MYVADTIYGYGKSWAMSLEIIYEVDLKSGIIY